MCSGSLVALRGIRALGAVFAGVALGGAAQSAMAQDQAAPADRALPRVEMWSGVEVFEHFRSAYAGATWAPFGGVRDDGFRLRGVVGYGNYDGDNSSGTVEFADVLIGYHKQLGPLTLKLLGGVSVTGSQPVPPLSPGQAPATEVGAKGVLEAWWNITDQAWTSLDMWWGATQGVTHNDYGSRLRLGWRLWPELSAGVEGGSGGSLTPDLALDRARIGAFLRYEWATGEVSISGGMAFDGPFDGHQQERDDPAPFGTVSVLTRF